MHEVQIKLRKAERQAKFILLVRGAVKCELKIENFQLRNHHVSRFETGSYSFEAVGAEVGGQGLTGAGGGEKRRIKSTRRKGPRRGVRREFVREGAIFIGDIRKMWFKIVTRRAIIVPKQGKKGHSKN
jgi:hypothetical protein